MNYKKNNIILNKVYKRNINTAVLKDLLANLAIDKNYYKIKGKINNDSLINHYNKLNAKEIKIDKKDIDYSNIEQNLKESERLLNDIQAKFEKIKGTNIKMDIEIKDIKIKSDDINIENLNNQNEKNQVILENTNKDKISIKEVLENSEIYENKINNSKKSILDIEWLNPFLDFMHNHSTLVLTIGSGLVMGGMWYMNNIGSLLTRLGIQIFSGTSAQNSGSITIPGFSPSESTGNIHRVNQVVTVEGNNNEATEIGRGFFRQLGEKVLKLIDAFIAKMESKQQKYK